MCDGNSRREQLELKKRLIIEDSFDWPLPSARASPQEESSADGLRYVGGVDIRYIPLTRDSPDACMHRSSLSL